MPRGIYDADANNVVDTVQSLHWNDIMSKPLCFPPIKHSHPISEVTNLSTVLGTFITKGELPAALAEDYYTADATDALLGTKAGVIHFHDTRYYTQPYIDKVTSPSGIDAALAVIEPLVHGHDDRYYTKAYIDDAFNTTNIVSVNDARYYTKPVGPRGHQAALVHSHDDLYFEGPVNGFFATGNFSVFIPRHGVLGQDIHHGLGRYPARQVVLAGARPP
jgi:hypothetical protein